MAKRVNEERINSLEQMHYTISNAKINLHNTKRYVFACSKCWVEHSNEFKLNINCNVDVETSCDPNELELLDDFMNLDPVLRSINRYCEHCNDETKWVNIDAGIYPLIHLLNIRGFSTMHSCEGHVKENNTWSTLPYIAFANTTDNVILFGKLKDSAEFKETDWYLDEGAELVDKSLGFCIRLHKSVDPESRFLQIDNLYQIIYNMIREG